MPEYPESVLTESRKGKTEVRALASKGEFIMCEYLDPESLEQTEKKKKLILKREDGETEEYFIIPMKQKGRDLLITPKEKSGEYIFWNKTEEKIEEL
ncbi:hypothetical protein AKJ35_00670 [candidate division MSBL1 archaeon SCGC-AAA833F18]|uniref:Uncharacterized protein n=2 Tax=candidate division MSBL1 TaxID=215777 RepID=A0A133VT06_9EURY|nr:hypothetical protein AKJ48_02270 [candidate division MSBL1 archaeon SCGC-AAA261O19]KXB09541.1 hypothetical protein AKJ35_00670 [candidate division MSBL1 archaeon SCGC-AAA833F18]